MGLRQSTAAGSAAAVAGPSSTSTLKAQPQSPPSLSDFSSNLMKKLDEVLGTRNQSDESTGTDAPSFEFKEAIPDMVIRPPFTLNVSTGATANVKHHVLLYNRNVSGTAAITGNFDHIRIPSKKKISVNFLILCSAEGRIDEAAAAAAADGGDRGKITAQMSFGIVPFPAFAGKATDVAGAKDHWQHHFRCVQNRSLESDPRAIVLTCRNNQVVIENNNRTIAGPYPALRFVQGTIVTLEIVERSIRFFVDGTELRCDTADLSSIGPEGFIVAASMTASGQVVAVGTHGQLKNVVLAKDILMEELIREQANFKKYASTPMALSDSPDGELHWADFSPGIDIVQSGLCAMCCPTTVGPTDPAGSPKGNPGGQQYADPSSAPIAAAAAAPPGKKASAPPQRSAFASTVVTREGFTFKQLVEARAAGVPSTRPVVIQLNPISKACDADIYVGFVTENELANSIRKGVALGSPELPKSLGVKISRADGITAIKDVPQRAVSGDRVAGPSVGVPLCVSIVAKPDGVAFQLSGYDRSARWDHKVTFQGPFPDFDTLSRRLAVTMTTCAQTAFIETKRAAGSSDAGAMQYFMDPEWEAFMRSRRFILAAAAIFPQDKIFDLSQQAERGGRSNSESSSPAGSGSSPLSSRNPSVTSQQMSFTTNQVESPFLSGVGETCFPKLSFFDKATVGIETSDDNSVLLCKEDGPCTVVTHQCIVMPPVCPSSSTASSLSPASFGAAAAPSAGTSMSEPLPKSVTARFQVVSFHGEDLDGLRDADDIKNASARLMRESANIVFGVVGVNPSETWQRAVGDAELGRPSHGVVVSPSQGTISLMTEGQMVHSTGLPCSLTPNCIVSVTVRSDLSVEFNVDGTTVTHYMTLPVPQFRFAVSPERFGQCVRVLQPPPPASTSSEAATSPFGGKRVDAAPPSSSPPPLSLLDALLSSFPHEKPPIIDDKVWGWRRGVIANLEKAETIDKFTLEIKPMLRTRTPNPQVPWDFRERGLTERDAEITAKSFVDGRWGSKHLVIRSCLNAPHNIVSNQCFGRFETLLARQQRLRRSNPGRRGASTLVVDAASQNQAPCSCCMRQSVFGHKFLVKQQQSSSPPPPAQPRPGSAAPVAAAPYLCEECREQRRFKPIIDVPDSSLELQPGGLFFELNFRVTAVVGNYRTHVGLVPAALLDDSPTRPDGSSVDITRTPFCDRLCRPGYLANSFGLAFGKDKQRMGFVAGTACTPLSSFDATSVFTIRWFDGTLIVLENFTSVVYQENNFNGLYRFAICFGSRDDTVQLLPSRMFYPPLGSVVKVADEARLSIESLFCRNLKVEDRPYWSNREVVVLNYEDYDQTVLVIGDNPANPKRTMHAWLPRAAIEPVVPALPFHADINAPAVDTLVHAIASGWCLGPKPEGLGRVTAFDREWLTVEFPAAGVAAAASAATSPRGRLLQCRWSADANGLCEVLEDVQVGDTVIRHPRQWFAGNADGRNISNYARATDFHGKVVSKENGFVVVSWSASGTTQKHRFGEGQIFEVRLLKKKSTQDTPGASATPAPAAAAIVAALATDVVSDPLSVLKAYVIQIPAADLDIPAPQEIAERRKRFLGKGQYGEVLRCHWKPKNQDVALKEFRFSHGDALEAQLKELSILGRLDHPNIVAMYGYCLSPWDPEELTVLPVMELIKDGKDLGKLLKENVAQRDRLRWTPRDGGPLGWQDFFAVAIDVLRGLSYLAERKLVHRDIKPANILVDTASGRMTAKISDFGLSVQNDRTMQTDQNACGSPLYVAAEVWKPGAFAVGQDGKRVGISPKVDVYAFGICLFEMISGTQPRSGGIEDVKQATIRGVLLPRVTGCPQSIHEIIYHATRTDPRVRGSASELLKLILEAQGRFFRGGSAAI